MLIEQNHNNFKKTRQVQLKGPYGSFTLGGPDFSVIAGPCSIESEAQFLETGTAVKASGAVMLRGGIWKLRTSSDSFQGLGPKGFQIAKDISKKLGMQLCSEVTDPRQIPEVDSVIDMYQVGSRNMHNYELLKELGKTKKPILLKRGFAALVDEWIKAADYIIKGGNDDVILCERGIRTFENTTRNTLDLNSVAYIKLNTNFPVVVDPSHGTGMRKLVSPLALASAAVGADGLILEVHPRPAEALSDGPQALTINDFEVLMNQLAGVLAALDRKLVKL